MKQLQAYITSGLALNLLHSNKSGQVWGRNHSVGGWKGLGADLNARIPAGSRAILQLSIP
jgi:hypothetical protein